MNSCGRMHLDLLVKHDLLITNTIFKHKLAHRTTWTVPEKVNAVNVHDGTT